MILHEVQSPPKVVLKSVSCPRPDYRMRRAQTLEHARGLDRRVNGFLLCNRLDILYLTGTSHGISWLVVLEDHSFAVSRQMLVEEVRAEAVDCEILLAPTCSSDQMEPEQFVVSELAKRGLQCITIDTIAMSAHSYLRISRYATGCGIELLDLPEVLPAIRALKDRWEQSLTRTCVRIAEQALNDLLAQGASALIGRTEREIAAELESRMIILGADRQGFPETGIIIASGSNSAKPHHTPGHRSIVEGEPLLIDWGAEVSGYRSDLTRTVFIRSVPAFAQLAYPVVEQALQRAAGRLRAGATTGEIDRAARDTITDAGYPEFYYGVGHGVGLAIHEAPWLRAHSDNVCEAEMLTTIEPGIYLPNVGGIRIENLYRVTLDGSECLGNLPTDLASMIIP
jgi:Xaa-Pro aminopeptidase